MSLRFRTALIGIIIAVAAAIGGALSSYFLLTARIEQDVSSSLATVSTFFLDEVRRSPFADPVTGQDLGQYSVQAVDRDGKRLPVAGIELPVAARDIDVALGRVGYYVREETIGGEVWRIRTTSTRYGAIQVALNYNEATAALETVRALVVAITLAVAAGGATVSWVTMRKATAPLQDLTVAVEKVAEGDLDIEVSAGGSAEVSRLARAFNQTIAALRRSRTEQQRIAQDVGHDLRTPLTSLMNNVTVLGKHRLEEEERKQILEDLANEVRTLKGLVDEIVDVASGSITTEEFEEHDVLELLEEMVGREARRYERNISCSGEPVAVRLQPQAFDRAVGNLIRNAVKYSDGEIEVLLRVDPHSVRIDVCDRGIGLQGGDPDLLFQRFWRADSARSSSGSGLGLAIVKDIAERHRGSVHATERPGGGAIIGFSIQR